MDLKKCPFCGYEGKMNISHKNEKRKIRGINHVIVKIKCGGYCTVNIKQAGIDFEKAFNSACNTWNRRF